MTTTLNTELGTLEQALAYLGRAKEVPFAVFDAIMHFHVLEMPDLGTLRDNFRQRDWYKLSYQLRSFADMRREVLINCAFGEMDREALRKQAITILLLRRLATVSSDFGQGAPEMDN